MPHKIGDLVESVKSGKVYRVTERWRSEKDRRQYAYGVVDSETGQFPNAFERDEIRATVLPAWMGNGVEVG